MTTPPIKLAQSTIGFSERKNEGQDPNRHPTTIEAVLPLVAANGFDGVEIWAPHLEGKSDEELVSLRKRIIDLGLRVPMLSSYFNFTKNEERAAESMQKAREILAQARLVGAEEIRVFTGGDRSADADQEQWDRCIACLQELCDSCIDDGIRLCLHTHDWNLVDTIAGCEKTLALLDRPNATLLFKPAYFAPEEHWTLEHLGPQTSCVQVTVDSPDKSHDLKDTRIDYKALMWWFARREQAVWFTFTWMGDDARGAGELAAPYLLQCRDAVMTRLSVTAEAVTEA